MKRAALMLAAAVVGLTLTASGTFAQQKSLKEQLTGAWTLVSIDMTMPDGTKQQPFGSNPKGILIFDASGHFSQMQEVANRVKFKSANRFEATADESAAALHESLAQYGTWSVNETDKIITLRTEGNSVPNAEGIDSKRLVTSITAEELKLTNPGPAVAGTNEIVYRRAK